MISQWYSKVSWKLNKIWPHLWIVLGQTLLGYAIPLEQTVDLAQQFNFFLHGTIFTGPYHQQLATATEKWPGQKDVKKRQGNGAKVKKREEKWRLQLKEQQKRRHGRGAPKTRSRKTAKHVHRIDMHKYSLLIYICTYKLLWYVSINWSLHVYINAYLHVYKFTHVHIYTYIYMTNHDPLGCGSSHIRTFRSDLQTKCTRSLPRQPQSSKDQRARSWSICSNS